MSRANTPKKLYEAIGKFFQSDYSQDELVEIYNDALKKAHSICVTYPFLPDVFPRKNDPLDGLQNTRKWCEKAEKATEDIVFSLEQQILGKVITQFKKIREYAGDINCLVNNDLKEKIKSETIVKMEKERKSIKEKKQKLRPDLSRQAIGANLILEAEIERDMENIRHSETQKAIQVYFSKDTAFNERLSKIDKNVSQAFEEINKLVGNNTPDGKLIDTYCKLMDIPLQQQYDEMSYSFQNMADILFENCNCLYNSIDNVTKTLENIQRKSKIRSKQPVGNMDENANLASKLNQTQQSESPDADVFYGLIWDKPFTEEKVRFIEDNFGPLANDLIELANLIRSFDNIPSKGKGDTRFIEIDKNFRWAVSSATFVPAIRILASAKFLRPVLESAAGDESQTKSFYEAIITALMGQDIAGQRKMKGALESTIKSKGENIDKNVSDFMHTLFCQIISSDNIKNRVEPIAKTLEAWHNNDLLIHCGKRQGYKAGDKKDNTNSVDFTSALWNGVSYQFNKTQAECIKLLWQEHEKGTNTLSEKTIGEKIGSEANNFRLLYVFRNNNRKTKNTMHPAWGKMIVKQGKGIYGLAVKSEKK